MKSILLLEPFMTGSHKSWANGLIQNSKHEVDVLSLPGYHWKWRMHGGAVRLAHEFLLQNKHYDLIIATDMLDLTTFQSLTRKYTSKTKFAIYFHENQITYPWSKSDPDPKLKRDLHYGFINFTSALSADKVFFNSSFHMNSFISGLKVMLESFPDYNELHRVEEITKKSEVLHLGMDLARFDEYKSEKDCKIPTFLWNHRWEYDKNPEDFFKALFILKDKRFSFNLIVLGESFSKTPPIFDEAKERLKDNIIHFGYAESFEEYAKLLWKADIALTTAIQDFFGMSAVEAIYCKCHPIFPDGYVYNEHIEGDFFYNTFDDLVELLERLLLSKRFESSSEAVVEYDWNRLKYIYNQKIDEIIGE